MDYYELVRGPLAVLAFAFLIAGSSYRLLRLYLSGKTSPLLYPGKSISGGVRSLIHGLLPFGANYMRKRPIFTGMTFLFHVSVLTVPLFCISHVILWFESFQVTWWTLPENLTDLMTLFVLLGCVFFIIRRILIESVQQVSQPTDYMLILLIFTSFFTGFLALHQWGPYRPLLILHIVSSEVLMIVIPFSKLMHMIYFAFARAYMGAEYGSVLKPRDW